MHCQSNQGSARGANYKHYREPGFSLTGKFVHLDCDSDERHSTYGDWKRWKHLCSPNRWRNAEGQPHRVHDLYRDRNWRWWQVHRDCDRNHNPTYATDRYHYR